MTSSGGRKGERQLIKVWACGAEKLQFFSFLLQRQTCSSQLNEIMHERREMEKEEEWRVIDGCL